MRVSAPSRTGRSSFTQRNSASSGVSARRAAGGLGFASLDGLEFERLARGEIDRAFLCHHRARTDRIEKVIRPHARHRSVIRKLERMRGWRQQPVYRQIARAPDHGAASQQTQQPSHWSRLYQPQTQPTQGRPVLPMRLTSANRNQGGIPLLCHMPGKCACFPDLKEPLAIDASEELDQSRDTSSPARLMARPNSGAVVSMEVLVEQDVVLPVGIGLEFLRPAVNRPTSSLRPGGRSGLVVGNFPGHLEKVHAVARTSWTFDLEVVAVIEVEGQQAHESRARSSASRSGLANSNFHRTCRNPIRLEDSFTV